MYREMIFLNSSRNQTNAIFDSTKSSEQPSGSASCQMLVIGATTTIIGVVKGEPKILKKNIGSDIIEFILHSEDKDVTVRFFKDVVSIHSILKENINLVITGNVSSINQDVFINGLSLSVF